MAAPVKIRSSGNTLNDSEIENIATEETLAALLAELKLLNTGHIADKQKKKTDELKKEKNLDAMLQRLLGTTGGGLAKRLIDHFTPGNKKSGAGSPASKDSAEALTGVAEEAEAVTGGLSGLFGSIMKFLPELAGATIAFEAWNVASHVMSVLAHAAGSMISIFSKGKTELSDYTDALEKATSTIPIISELTSILAGMVGLVSSWNRQLYELNAVGASFNGSMIEMIQGAADSGMTLERYSKVITDNAATFAKFGTVMTGVNIYTNLSSIAMRENVNQLTAMGISLDQYQEELPGIMAIFGASMKARGASEQELNNSALELTEQFNAMSKITGQTRQEQAKAAEEAQADAAYQIHLSKISNEAKERETASMNEIRSVYGQTAAEAYKMNLLGIVPLNKEMQVLIATVPGMEENFDRLRNLTQSGLGFKEFNKQMDESVADMVESGLKSGMGMEEVLKAGTARMSGTPELLASINKELFNNAKGFYDQGVFNKKAFLQRIEDGRLEAKQDDEVRKNLADFSADVKKLQAYFYNQVLTPLMKLIGPLIGNMVDSFQTHSADFTSIISKIVDIVKTTATWVASNVPTIEGWISTGIDIIVDIVKFVAGIASFVNNNFDLIVGIITFIKDVALIGLGVIIGAIIAILAPFWPVILGFVTVVTLLAGAMQGLLAFINWAMSIIPGFHQATSSAATPPSFNFGGTAGVTAPSTSGYTSVLSGQNAATTPIAPSYSTSPPQTNSDDINKSITDQVSLLVQIRNSIDTLNDNVRRGNTYAKQTAAG